jgi:hypothetical protein
MDLTSTTPMSVSRKAFQFPVLKPAMIIQCLAELGCEITKEELEEPQHHKEKIRKIFMTMVSW